MACSYFPRPLDREILDVLESRRPGGLIGVRKSGVTTSARRLATIANVPFRELLQCAEYAVVEVSIGEVGVAIKCGVFATATGSLEDVLKTMGEGIYVMPPMSIAELREFLRLMGIKAADEVIEELLYKTGGYPPAVCNALAKLNFPNSISPADVKDMREEPTWFLEFVDKYGESFLISAILSVATEDELKELGGEPGFWMYKNGPYYKLKLPWLQFFAVKYKPDLAVEVLENALKIAREKSQRLIYTAVLWQLGRKHADLREYVDALEKLPPTLSGEMAIFLLNAAAELGDREVEARALRVLSENLGLFEYSTTDVVTLAKRAAGLAPLQDSYIALFNLGVLLMRQGRLQEAESILSIVEDLLFKSRNDEEWLAAKRTLNLLQAYKEGLLGNWEEVRRLLEDELTTLKFYPNWGELVRRSLAWAYIMLGDFKNAAVLLKGDAGGHKLALLFLTSKKLGRVRELAKRKNEPVISALAGIALGIDVSEELKNLPIRPEMKEALYALIAKNPADGLKRVVNILPRVDITDRLSIYLHAVESYLQLKAGLAKREEILDFYERIKLILMQTGMKGAVRFVKPTRPSLARLALYFL